MTRLERIVRTASSAALVVLAAVGCSDDADSGVDASLPTAPAGSAVAAGDEERSHPDVVDAVASFDAGADTWTFDVTISSPYDSPERYADGWRVVGPDGTVFGEHTLTHHHATEQPFTRRQRGVVIPADVDVVTIEGRDLVNGFGGVSVTVVLVREAT